LIFVAGVAAVARAQDVVDPARDPVVLAVKKVVPSVVNIGTERLVERQFSDPYDDLFRQFFGLTRRPPVRGIQSLGSGVVVDADGWIVTNFHVVRRATKITVMLSDGGSYTAQYVSGDETNDVALIKIEPKQPLTAIEFAGDGEPLLGETVIAVGDPFGLDYTVTKGIISATNRRYEAGDTTFEDILQTDAAINPGNSGGPLVNLRGQLVGINMAILSEAQGIGFAIPARRVASLLAGWFSPEKRARLSLGLRFKRGERNIEVAEVKADSPAAKAGIAAGDAVVSVDKTRFTQLLPLQRYLIHKKAGDTVRIEIERSGTRRTCEVTLQALPKLSARELMLKKFGLQVQELTPELADAMGLELTQGLLVTEVQKGGPAAAAEFRRGVVITHVNGEEITSMDRLSEQLGDIDSGESVSMAVIVTERHRSYTLQQATSVTLKAR
jgi:S1-C subfamily serine protease